MALTREDVDHVAALARLGLSDDEKDRLRDQLSVILDNIAILSRLDTSAISPTAQVIPLRNVARRDEVAPSLPVRAALANAPRRSGDFFEVLAVLGGDDPGAPSA